MKEKFPFSAPELVVTKDMCDVNGHMNVAYYLKIFDECSRPLFFFF
jgi:acyl-CoA thioesterase FadM